MQDLERFGLWGNGLIIVETPEMVKRYNACLRDMGLPETALTRFGIDRVGWSPEIAAEMNDQYYLSHGEANHMVIILTPEQRDCPIYVPFHSFDLDLISRWFDGHKPQIVELTKTTGLWLHIDQRIEKYHDPSDVLLFDNIMVQTHAPSDLIKKAADQKALVSRFMASPHDPSVMSEMLCAVPQQIQASLGEIGAVMYRQMVIEDMSYSVPCSFFLRAFGGIFVLRSLNCELEEIITKSDTMNDIGVTSVTDRKILKTLEKFGLISYETERWMNNLHLLKIIRDSFLVEVLDELYPELDFATLTDIQKMEILCRDEVLKKLPEEYNLLDRVISSLENGRIPKRIPKKIKPYLAHPLRIMDKSIQEVVWYLLALVCDSRPIIRIYRYDKEVFIKKYQMWKKPQRSWAIDRIKKYHRR